MDLMTSGIEGTTIYPDDIVAVSTSPEELKLRLTQLPLCIK